MRDEIAKIYLPEEHECRGRSRAIEHLQYFSNIGLWGDAILSLGIAKALGGDDINILHAGPLAEEIGDFIREQTFVASCKTLLVPYGPEWNQFFHRNHYELRQFPDKPLIDMFEQARINSKWISRGHLDTESCRFRGQPFHWSGVKLQSKYWQEANTLFSKINEIRSPEQKVILLNPLSISSSGVSDHWSIDNWNDSLCFLLNNTPHLYILVGPNTQTIGSHSRLIDFTKSTSNNQTVFALSQICNGIITTSNSLAMFVAVSGSRALVVGNKPLKNTSSPFRKFLNQPNIEILDYDDDFCNFVKKSSEFGGIKF